MSTQEINSCIREAKRVIPDGGLGKDMHLLLDDVLHKRSDDDLADVERVASACKPLPWDWAKRAVELLGKAAAQIRERKQFE